MILPPAVVVTAIEVILQSVVVANSHRNDIATGGVKKMPHMVILPLVVILTASEVILLPTVVYK